MIDLAFNSNIKVYALEVDDSKIRTYKGFEENNNLNGVWTILLWLNLILVCILVLAIILKVFKKESL